MPKAHFKLDKTSVDEWIPQIDEAITAKETELREYKEAKQRLLPKLEKALDKGVDSRKLTEITGISHATICRWVNEFRKSEKNDA